MFLSYREGGVYLTPISSTTITYGMYSDSRNNSVLCKVRRLYIHYTSAAWHLYMLFILCQRFWTAHVNWPNGWNISLSGLHICGYWQNLMGLGLVDETYFCVLFFFSIICGFLWCSLILFYHGHGLGIEPWWAGNLLLRPFPSSTSSFPVLTSSELYTS